MLIIPVIVFGIAAVAGLGVLVLLWPLLENREHRGRLMGALALVTMLVACAVFGQYLLDGFSQWCGPSPVATCRPRYDARATDPAVPSGDEIARVDQLPRERQNDPFGIQLQVGDAGALK